MIALDCVAFMLIGGHAVLAEKRREARSHLPGIISIPGGHLEPGESIEDALFREAREELGIALESPTYVCSLLHRAQELRKLHYWSITRWQGEITPHEADSLVWIGMTNLGALDLEVDRVAVRQWLRNCRESETNPHPKQTDNA